MKKFMSFVLTGAIALSGGVYCTGSTPDFSAFSEDYTEITYENVKYNKYADHVEVGNNKDNKELTEVVIPDKIEGLPVTIIESGAFNYCSNLKSVVMPDSVTLVNAVAFAGCENLESVTLSNSIEKVSFGTFTQCSNLKSVNIPDSVRYIGMGAFEDCSSLTSIVLPDAVTEISDFAFGGCKSLEEITIPDSVNTIGYYCFSNTKWLENKRKENPLVIVNDILIDGVTCEGDVTVPDSVKRIGMYAFSNCTGLTSITICNPDCEIFDYEDTICNSQGGYDFESGTMSETVFNGTIYGYTGSTAQAYAEKYGYKFETIGEQPTTEALKGDANGDNSVTIADAVAILQYLANSDEYPLSEQGAENADVLGDDGVNTEDALQIQKLDAGVIEKL